MTEDHWTTFFLVAFGVACVVAYFVTPENVQAKQKRQEMDERSKREAQERSAANKAANELAALRAAELKASKKPIGEAVGEIAGKVIFSSVVGVRKAGRSANDVWKKAGEQLEKESLK